jgi:hypothetical protein
MHESTRRAYETIARIDAKLRQWAAEPPRQEPSPAPAIPADPDYVRRCADANLPIDPTHDDRGMAWRRGNLLRELGHGQQRARDADMRKEITELRAEAVGLREELMYRTHIERDGDKVKISKHLFPAFSEFAAVIGEEAGKVERELRAEIEALRARVEAISKPRSAA